MYTGSLAYLLVTWILSAVALYVTSAIVPGFKLKNFTSALLTAAVLGIVSWFLKPLLLFLTLPLNILTLGLFTIVVNAILLKISAWILKDFHIESWFSAIIGALILALVSTGLNYLFF